MPRPVTNTPRLSAIDPATLAAEVCAGVADHLSHLLVAVALDVGDLPQMPDPAGMLTMRHTVAELAAYARDGAQLDAPVEEYLIPLLPLWQYAAHPRGHVSTPEFDSAIGGDLDSLDGDDWRGQLVLVMVAAVAREELAQGHPLTVARLAALASMSPDSVRLLGRQGEIALSGSPLSCAAADARRWLSGRGVAV